MKRLLMILFSLACTCLGQGVLLQIPAVTTTATIGATTVTVPAPNVSVTVCASNGSGLPCTPLASMYQNQAMTVAASNPGVTNSQGVPLFSGFASAWVAPGTYIVSETGAAITGYSFTYQAQCSLGSACTLTSANVAALTATSPAITPTSIEKIAYSDQYDFSAVSGLPALSAGAQAVLAPWASVPPGIMSGAIGIVSTSVSSPTVTWVSGDKFNALWAAGKPVWLDGTVLSVVSCAATTCTLSGNAPRTTGHAWIVVGYPTPVYLSGGAGTAESVDVAGIGAECPSGGAPSICFTAANGHSGAWNLSSSTDGIQEAVNAIEAVGGGRVVVPSGAWAVNAPVLISRNNITMRGAGSASTLIQFPTTAPSYSGAANGVVTVLNANYASMQDFGVSGPSVGGGYHAVAWMSTTGDGGPGNGSMSRVLVEGAAGNSTDFAGAVVKSAGVFDDGFDGLTLHDVYAISNNDGFEFGSSGGGSGSRTRILGGDYSENANAGFEFLNGATGTSLIGPAIFNNAGPGISINNNYGMSIDGAHIEANNPAISIQQGEGIVIHGNLLSQHLSVNTCIVCGPPGSLSNGLSVVANAFDLVDYSIAPTITSLVSLESANGHFAGNMVEAFLTTNRTVVNGFTFLTGSGPNFVDGLPLGPNAVLAGKALTVTDVINDLSNSITTNAVPYTGLPNGAAPLFRTNQGLLITGESSASGKTLGITEAAGGWSLNHFGVNSIMGGTFDGTTSSYYPFTLAAGGSLPSGQTLTNGGTIAGGTISAANLLTPTVGGGSPLNRILLATTVLTYPAIAAQSCQEQAVAISGASTTGVASASPAASLGSANLSWSAWVSAAGSVSVRVCNPTTGAITPSAVSWNAEVVQ